MRESTLRLVIAADRETLAGDGLARLQDRLRQEAVSCADLAAAFTHALEIGDREPLARALAAVAAEADRSGLTNAFHNPAHSREVGVNWWLLARLDGSSMPALSPHAIMLGLIAAFGHDLQHDGGSNGEEPFRLETMAAAAVDDLLRREGVADESRAAVSAMILCTDIRAGYPHLAGTLVDDPRLGALAQEAVLLSARMLRDADLLPSAGTSIVAYRTRSAELEREAGLPSGGLSGEAARAFFDHVVEHRFLSPAAQAFAGNLHAIAAEATGR